MKLSKLLFPIWNAFMSLCDDQAGPDQISKNNQELARELDLKAMESKLDKSLANETKESLTEWIKQKRNEKRN